jgi:hypothetical protein
MGMETNMGVIWINGECIGEGAFDFAYVEIEKPATQQSIDFRAFSPGRALTPPRIRTGVPHHPFPV